MRLPTVRYFDPFDALIRCFQREWPHAPSVEIQFVARAEPGSPVPAEALGCTIEPDDGISVHLVFVVADQLLWQMIDVLAHELAHVAVGSQVGHGPEWESAFARIRELYLEEHEWSRLAGVTGPVVDTCAMSPSVGRVGAHARRVLDAIQDYYGQHAAAPSFREIGDALEITSSNGVAHHVDRLQAEQLLRNTDGTRQLSSTEGGWADRGGRLEPQLPDGLAVQLLWVIRDQLGADPRRALAAIDRLREYVGRQVEQHATADGARG